VAWPGRLKIRSLKVAWAGQPAKKQCIAMKIAFHAPMKSPLSPHPSGDRTIGRLLIKALTRGRLDVRIASELRTWVPRPDADTLAKLRITATHEAETLVDGYLANDADWVPDVWLTYHSYYKAPDMVGPAVSARLGIPYVIVEGSFSARRMTGEWADWVGAARASLEQAHSIISFTERDQRGLSEIVPASRLHRLAPFLDLELFDPETQSDFAPARRTGDSVQIVSVAMIRPGAKQASYQLLADALRLLPHTDWRLDIIGDGAARSEIEQLFADFCREQIVWHGRCDVHEMASIMRRADVFAWPGIDEAFGMVYLEAQAFGLPVAACRVAGVPEVVHDGQTGLLADPATPSAFAVVLNRLLLDADLRRRLGSSAQEAVRERHSIGAASVRLCDLLSRLVVRP